MLFRSIFGTTPAGARNTDRRSEKMRIVGNGNVGIGTSGPTAKLTSADTSGTGTINLGDFTASAANANPLIRLINRNAANTGTTSVDFLKTYQSGFGIHNNDTDSSNFTRFIVGASERMRIDSSGRVGIGATNPSIYAGDCKFVVNKSGGARIGIAGSSRRWYLEGRSGIDAFTIGARAGGNTTDSPKLTVLTSGGITFNSDTAAANALDDYEEGTWTPSIFSGITSPTLQLAIGYYTKIGNLVHFNFEIRANTGTGNSLDFIVAGLPFTSANVGANFGSVTINYNNILTAFGELRAGHISTNNTVIRFYNGTVSIKGNSMGLIWSSGKRLICSGSYIAA